MFSFGKGELIATADTKGENYTAYGTKSTTVDSPGYGDSELSVNPLELTTRIVDVPNGFNSLEVSRINDKMPANSSNKVSVEENFDDISSNSNVYQDYSGDILGMKNAVEVQSGYDSQYEEGELRESVVDTWEEDASEEGEVELVDYGSDNAQVEELEYCEKDNSTEIGAEQVMPNNVPQKNYESFLRGSSKADAMEAGSGKKTTVKQFVKDVEVGELVSGADKVVVERDLCGTEKDSNANKSHTGLHVEGPRVCLQGIRSTKFGDSNSRERDFDSGKSIGRGRYSLHTRGRGWGPEHRLDSSGARGPGHRYAHSDYDQSGFEHPRPKKEKSSGFFDGLYNTILKVSGVSPDGRCRRPSLSSQAVCRSLTRRGLPEDRDEGFDVHMGYRPVGEMSPDKRNNVGRGRSGKYGPKVVGTGLRESYISLIPDDGIDSSRRERSFSPIQRRFARHVSRPHTRSPSRSRSRSPHVWSSPRRRNEGKLAGTRGLRKHSRSSPNFKHEARMERVWSRHQQRGYAPEHVTGFVSHRSSHSPQHASGWIDERKDMVDHFREYGHKARSSISDRRSPGRVFPRKQRFDFTDSLGRSKPDQNWRPVNPGRFHKMFEAGRGPRYEGSDDVRRKRCDRYGMVHPLRHYDRDSHVKRSCYGVEDGFVSLSSDNEDTTEFQGMGSPKDHNRSTDGRLGDASRSAREEKSHFRSGRGSFGTVDCDEDLAPRRRRP